MKRRKMLLCVTATSMATAVACTPAAQPVGFVGRPDDSPTREVEAGALDDAGDAPVPDGVPPVRDAGNVGRVAADRDAAPSPPNFHPDRVGTSATVDDSLAPSVGTTAHVPDKKK